MTETSSEFAAHLAAELGACVHLPETPAYRTALDGVHFPEASRRIPLCVVQPRDVEDISRTLRVAQVSGGRVTVRGGGLSSNCVAEDAAMIDLSTHLGSALPMDGSVRVGGGATVGTALDALAPSGRVIPVGVAQLPGMGMVTRGGIGYLTRSLGLTMDHLVEVDIVLPSGEVVHLSEDSTGEEAELWWAVRGCAPCFGVVTGAVLRTHEQGPVFVDRVVVDVDALPAYFAVAPELPRHTTMSAVMGRVPGDDRDDPVLFLYTACRSQVEADIATARSATTAVAAASPAEPRYRSEMSGRYLKGLPQFAIPGPAGEEPAPITLPPPDADRGWFLGKAPFAGPTLGPEVAAVLGDAIRSAPTTSCRIDFQHTGGALADIADTATSFWGRGAEWNIPLNAVWANPDDGQACHEWARATLGVLAEDTIGGYSVELRPGFDETQREVERAYGANLEPLRALRRRYDPSSVLGGCLL